MKIKKKVTINLEIQGVAYMIGREYPYCPNCGAAMDGATDD